VILVDTCVWIDHFRSAKKRLSEALAEGLVLAHPFVIEEIACGSLSRRDDVLALLAALKTTPTVNHQEAIAFIARHRLFGSGLGSVDVHLLASAKLADAKVWTTDKQLLAAARRLELV
jgi:hypothetical protein